MNDLALNLAPPLFLLASWLFFMGLMTKQKGQRIYWLLGAGLVTVVVLALVAPMLVALS